MNRPITEATAIRPKPIQALNWVHPEARDRQGYLKSIVHRHPHGDVEIGEGTWIGSNVTTFPWCADRKACSGYSRALLFPRSRGTLKFAGRKTAAGSAISTTIRGICDQSWYHRGGKNGGRCAQSAGLRPHRATALSAIIVSWPTASRWLDISRFAIMPSSADMAIHGTDRITYA